MVGHWLWGKLRTVQLGQSYFCLELRRGCVARGTQVTLEAGENRENALTRHSKMSPGKCQRTSYLKRPKLCLWPKVSATPVFS